MTPDDVGGLSSCQSSTVGPQPIKQIGLSGQCSHPLELTLEDSAHNHFCGFLWSCSFSSFSGPGLWDADEM